MAPFCRRYIDSKEILFFRRLAVINERDPLSVRRPAGIAFKRLVACQPGRGPAIHRNRPYVDAFLGIVRLLISADDDFLAIR